MIKRTVQQCVVFGALCIGGLSTLEAAQMRDQQNDHGMAELSLSTMDSQRVSTLTSSPTCPVYLVVGSRAERSIIIQNNSVFTTAQNIRATNLWPDATQDASQCVSVAPGHSCTIFLTAGTQTQPTTLITFVGTNTSTVGLFMNTIAALAVGQVWKGGIIYTLNADGSSGQVVANQSIPDVPFWDPLNGSTIIGALSTSNGAANTNAIANQLTSVEGQSLSSYSAGTCVLFSASDLCASYNDWYLPAIDQLGVLMNSGVKDDIFVGCDVSYWTSTQSVSPMEAVSACFLPPISIQLSPKVPPPNNQPKTICVSNFSYELNPESPA